MHKVNSSQRLVTSSPTARFAWPFQHGRTPVTVMVLTLLASLLARGGLRVLAHGRDALLRVLARRTFKHTPAWWQEIRIQIA